MNWFRQQFNRNDFWWAAVAIVLGAYFLSKAIVRNQWTLAGWPHPEILAGATGLAFGVVLLGHYNFARWVGLAWVVCVGLTQLHDGYRLGWDWGAIGGIVLFVVMAVYFQRTFFSRSTE